MKEEIQEITGKVVEIKIENDDGTFKVLKSVSNIKDNLNTIKLEKDLSEIEDIKPQKFCNICEKEFINSNVRRIHERTVHKGEKPYICDICDKRFGKLSHLKIHKRIHTGENPYQCNQCDKTI